jgi:hypothetical protein
MDKVQKPSDAECQTLSSEPFRIYLPDMTYAGQICELLFNKCFVETICI